MSQNARVATWVPTTTPPDASNDGVLTNGLPGALSQIATRFAAAGGGSGGGGIPEAPLDGTIYGRKDAGWVPAPTGGSGGGISDAPNDGKNYARKSLGWSDIDALFAPIASPTFTGVPKAPTAAVDTNTVQLATTAFVLGQGSVVADGNPAANGTPSRGSSNHFARADHVHPSDPSKLSDAPSDGTTYARRNGAWRKAVDAAGDTMTGALTLPGNPTNPLEAATKQYVDTFAPLLSPLFTGDPKAPTPASNDNDTSIATTAFVNLFFGAQAGIAPPEAPGTAAPGVSLRFAREDHVHPADPTRAPIANPVFTGDPQAPTPATADNDTSIATTAFVKNQGYAPTASPTFTGDPKAPTPSPGDNDTSIATTAFTAAAVAAGITGLAPINNPVFTGDARGPTPAPGDNDTSLATTAFVQAAIAAAPPPTTLPLSRQVNTLINAHLTSANQGYVPGFTTICIMKDGSMRSAGDIVTGNNNPLGKGSGGNSIVSLDLRKISLPSGLLGTPVALYHNGQDGYILTDQGDVCCAGRNTNGALGLGDTTARDVYTLLPSTSIGPRSAGGASRKITAIGVGPVNQNAASSQGATTFFLCADNTLWAAGNNGNGQAGWGDTTVRSTITQCVKNDGSGNVAIADCAKIYTWSDQGSGCSSGYIDTTGKVRLTGRLQGGSPGRNTGTAGQNVFRPIFTTTDIGTSDLPAAYQALDIAYNQPDTIVVRCADKCAYAFGTNSSGQCGIGNTTQQNIPRRVGITTAVAATLNGTVERIFSCQAMNAASGFLIQLTDGSVYCWGAKSSSSLPLTAADGTISTPTQAQGLLSGAGVPVINKMFGNCVPGTSPGSQGYFVWLANSTILAWGPAAMDGSTSATFSSANPRLVAMPARAGSPTIVGCNAMSSGNNTAMHVDMLLSDGTLLVMGYNPPDAMGGVSYQFNEASIPG